MTDGLRFGLLGQGISYSASPAMMTAAFAALGMPHTYTIRDVAPADLPAAVEALRASDAGGSNVTVPHKAGVARLMDDVSVDAAAADAVNVVVRDGGRLVGHNTDLPAIIDELRLLRPDGLGRVVLLGAGGASRAVELAVARLDGTLLRAARSDGSWARLPELLDDADLVVNATPIGTAADESPVPAALLRPDLAVFDLVYRPSPTLLVRQARAVGAPARAGGGMLLGQAWRSLELWLGVPAPIDAMRAALRASVGVASMPDTITLVGLSGSGKSSVGRMVAASLGRPFVDVDQRISAVGGGSPATIIGRDGEARFREIEAAEVRRAVTVPGAVIATGGGAIIDPLSRWALWDAGLCVWLDAPDSQLAKRLRRSDEQRPLVAGDTLEALARLRTAREPFYAAADMRIESKGSARSVADAVITAASKPHPQARRLFDARVRRDHQMGPRMSHMVYGRDLDVATIEPLIADVSSGTPVVVADDAVAAALPGLMAAFPGPRQLRVTGGERTKRMHAVERLLEEAAAARAERGDAWIAIGGGTTGDLVGTAAALYLRGVPLVQVPTTWLAQSDSAIGGKVAVDLAAAKNAAGAFWPPVAIIGDVAALRTLSRELLLDGLAEVVKSAIIGDPWLWALLETRGEGALGPADGAAPDEAARYAMVERAMHLKLGVVDRDPFEAGERRTLNLGHTLGHALEIESRYHLPHGQAVVLGLRAVVAIAEARGAEHSLGARVDDLLRRLGYRLTRTFDRAAVREALGSDKKRVRGRQRWILPMAIGTVIDVDDVTESELDLALDRITPFERGDRA